MNKLKSKSKNPGVKSKKFGVFWETMFLTALCYPEKFDKRNKKHVEKQKHLKIYYDSLQHVVPCKYCKQYTKEVLMVQLPLNYSGRVQLIYSIYLWKKSVSEKLRNQGNKVKDTPPFSKVLAKYYKMYASCDKKLGRCV